MEYIICSAIYYNNGIKYPNQPKNISEGVVVCGFGHGDCISLLAQIFPDLSYKENYTEGFLTSVRRYVDRKEAGMLAIKSGQIKELKHFGGKELDSSDLYNSNPPIDNTLCVCDFPESGERCTIHKKVEDAAKEFVIEFKGVKIAKGKTHWGAEPHETYFVFKLGDILETRNCAVGGN